MENKEPNIRFKSIKDTKARRKSMVIKVLSFNVQKNKLSKHKKSYLKLLNLEAKYYYNYLISLSQVSIVDDFGNIIYPNNLFQFNTKSNQIFVYEFSSNSYLLYTIKVLSSQVKQEILKKITSSIKAISAAKAKGRKTGKLKFKPFVNIPFKQFDKSFYLSDDCKKLSLQGNKKDNFHLIRNRNLSNLCKNLNLTTKTISNIKGKNRNFSQTHNNVSLKKLIDLKIIEIANAELISSYKKDSYTFNLTVYFNPEYLVKANLYQGIKLTKEQRELFNNTNSGLDAGIASELTLNCDETYASISLDSRKHSNELKSNKLKNLIKYQRRINRHISKSKKAKIKSKSNLNLITVNPFNLEVNNLNKELDKPKEKTTTFRNNEEGFNTRSYKANKVKLNKIQTSITNHKLDTVIKIDSLLSNFKRITFQDEMVKSWHMNKKFKFSSAIQNGILGKTYAKLKNRYDDKKNKISYKYKKLSSNLRTTKTCICANVNNNITLKDRVYSCPHCGYVNNRDTHSSYIINNTLNHVEYTDLEYLKTEKLNGCGKQPKDYVKSDNKDLLFNSNLGEIKTTNNTRNIYNLLCVKFKSLNLLIKLNYKVDDKFYTLEAPTLMSV
jgi:hypothetical protein